MKDDAARRIPLADGREDCRLLADLAAAAGTIVGRALLVDADRGFDAAYCF